MDPDDAAVRVTFRLPRDLHRRLEVPAVRSRRSLNAEMLERLQQSIGEEAVPVVFDDVLGPETPSMDDRTKQRRIARIASAELNLDMARAELVHAREVLAKAEKSPRADAMADEVEKLERQILFLDTIVTRAKTNEY